MRRVNHQPSEWTNGSSGRRAGSSERKVSRGFTFIETLVVAAVLLVVIAAAMMAWSHFSRRAVREELQVRFNRESDGLVSHLKKDIRSSSSASMPDGGLALEVNAIDSAGVPVPTTVIYHRDGSRLVRSAQGETQDMMDFASAVSAGFTVDFNLEPVSSSALHLSIRVKTESGKTIFEREEQLSPDRINDEP